MNNSVYGQEIKPSKPVTLTCEMIDRCLEEHPLTWEGINNLIAATKLEIRKHDLVKFSVPFPRAGNEWTVLIGSTLPNGELLLAITTGIVCVALHHYHESGVANLFTDDEINKHVRDHALRIRLNRREEDLNSLLTRIIPLPVIGRPLQ